MLPEAREDQGREEVRADLRQALMAAFCTALHGTRLPPMAVMALAAEAVGSVYREVADAHLGDQPCPCGWHPSPAADVAALQAALALTAEPAPGVDLARIAVVGRA